MAVNINKRRIALAVAVVVLPGLSFAAIPFQETLVELKPVYTPSFAQQHPSITLGEDSIAIRAAADKPVVWHLAGRARQDHPYFPWYAVGANITAATFSNLVPGESFTYEVGSLSRTFADKYVGMAKRINVGGATSDKVVNGESSDKRNYSFTFADSATANVTPKQTRITWQAADKVYDAKTDARMVAGTPFVFADDSE